jgi:hypothetical protein
VAASRINQLIAGRAGGGSETLAARLIHLYLSLILRRGAADALIKSINPHLSLSLMLLLCSRALIVGAR